MTLLITYSDTAVDSSSAGAGRRTGLGGWIDVHLAFQQAIRLRVYGKLAAKLRQDGPTATIQRSLLKQAAQREKNGFFATARVLRQIERRMTEGGMAFPDAMRPYVADDEFMQMLAGYRSGNLAEALELICETRKRMKRVMRAVRGVSWAPIGYMVVNFGFIAIISGSVLPALTQITAENKAPNESLRTMVWVSNHATPLAGLVCALAAAAAIGLVIYSLRRLTGRKRVFLERFLPWSTYRDIQGYLWTCSFISYLKSGLGEEEALRAQAEDASPWLAERLSTFARLMTEKSMSLPEAMISSGFRFPSPEIVDDVDETWGGAGDYDRLLGLSKEWIVDLEEKTTTQAETIRILFTVISLLISASILILGNNIGAEMRPVG